MALTDREIKLYVLRDAEAKLNRLLKEPIARLGDFHAAYLTAQEFIEPACRTVWNCMSPESRVDFGGRFDIYLAYNTASKLGLVKVFGDKARG